MQATDMQGMIALVTGATSGIGQATAELLARRGARVVVAGRRADRGEEVVAGIRARGGEASFARLDVLDAASVREVVEGVVATYGRLDLAVNNAGIAGGATPFLEQDPEVARRMLETNVMGVLLAMQHEIRAMLATGGGAIVNTSSIVGLKAIPGAAAYTASKFALEGLTKAVALEVVGQGIRINAVAPGPTLTEIIPHTPEMLGALADRVPMKRMGRVEEIARGIVWLLSDEASFTTGATLALDGGVTAA